MYIWAPLCPRTVPQDLTGKEECSCWSLRLWLDLTASVSHLLWTHMYISTAQQDH